MGKNMFNKENEKVENNLFEIVNENVTNLNKIVDN
jgi:hypothetical protein